MPVTTDDVLTDKLAKGEITAVALDTNVFVSQRLNFKSATLRAAISLRDRPFPLLMSSTVLSEVRGRTVKAMEDALRAVKKASGEALSIFDTTTPTRDEILDQIAGSLTPAKAAEARVNQFLADSGCEVLDDASFVDTTALFDAYFNRCPPFSQGKKAEFPDALALFALENAANRSGHSYLIVSEDGDWRAFCENSHRLYLVPKVEKALALINNAPINLKRAILAWIAAENTGAEIVAREIRANVERLDVEISVYASAGEVEAQPYETEVVSIEWPDENDIDIIETDQLADGHIRVIISLPVVVDLRIVVDLSFSIWDSVDREYVSMGGRLYDGEQIEHIRVTVTIDAFNVGKKDEEIEYSDLEIDIANINVDLGMIDVFEPDED